MSRQWCLRQVSKSNFVVVWRWPLTSWPPKLALSSPFPVDHVCQFAIICFRNIVFTSLTYIGLLWPWPLTYWPQKLMISSPCSIDHLCQFAASLIYSFVHNGGWKGISSPVAFLCKGTDISAACNRLLWNTAWWWSDVSSPVGGGAPKGPQYPKFWA